MQVTAHPIVVRRTAVAPVGAPSISSRDYEVFYAETRKDSILLNESMTRIKLRLNPHDTEPESAQILQLLIDLEKELKRLGQEGFLARIQELTDAIEHASQPLLKKEWNRVKQGEKVYRNAKKIATWSSVALAALLLAILFVISGFFLGVVHASIQPTAPTNPCSHVQESH